MAEERLERSPGLIEAWTTPAKRECIDIVCGARAYKLVADACSVRGVVVQG